MPALVADTSASLKAPAATDIAAKVTAQLARDYPPGALSWVSSLAWTGPVKVPVTQIDRTTGTTDWAAAAADKAKLQVMGKRIMAGWRKPVVLIRRPGSARLFAVDGHSRALASAAQGQPVTAYVGTATTAHGPWEQVHSRQLANDATAVDLASTPGLTSRSGMISLDLPPGTIKPPPGGVDGHHITVVYLGADVNDAAFVAACGRARVAASQMDGPLTGSVAGVGTFPPSDSSDGQRPAFAPVRLPGATALRSRLADLSASEHKDWVPHVTLAYVGKDDPLPPAVPATPVKFTHVSVHRGEDVKRFPLGGDSAGYANDAPAIDLAEPERVPPGRPEGGQFTVRPPVLTRYATPQQTADAVNAMGPDQRAMCRRSVLEPPGYRWSADNLMTEAK
jgi:2'-5' RNA ligase